MMNFHGLARRLLTDLEAQPLHDPAECDVDECATCQSFYRDEAAERQFQSTLGE